MRFVFLALLLGVLVGAGCDDVDIPDHPDPAGHRSVDEVSEQRVDARDVRFDPSTITVTAATPTQLTLANADDVEHDFQVDEIDVEINDRSDESEEHGEDHGGDLSVHTEAGETGSVTFVAHESGTYEFYCTVTGHKDAGIVGTLIVE